MNMNKWISDMLAAKHKKALPVLSFPCISLMDITVSKLISSPELQAKGMKLVADEVDSAASVSMMDLSVEAEAFGSTIRVSDYEVPTVIGAIVTSEDEANALKVPQIGTGRTGLYVSAIGKVCKLITDRPVLAGIIGPFSLAGRLMGVTEALMNCYTEPDMVKITLNKAADFLIDYANAYKSVGANGIVMAEPLTGLLSPELAEEFSEPFVKRIIDAVKDESFAVIYHNCGGSTVRIIDSILRVGASAYHFGNAISMAEMLTKVPSDTVVMGNIDPAGQFNSGTPDSIREATLSLMNECCRKYPNFVISSGCDIPPTAPWDNIHAFFAAAEEYYGGNN